MERGSEASKQGKRARKALKFKKNLTKLFDITFCQCLNFASCCCPKEMRVPKREKPFQQISVLLETCILGNWIKKMSKANKKKMIGRMICWKEKRKKSNKDLNVRSNFHHLIPSWHLLLILMLLVVAVVLVAALSEKNFLI